MKFETKIYHLNVDEEGNIALDILKEKEWEKQIEGECNSSAIIRKIHLLLQQPNEYKPLSEEIADVYKSDPEKYESEAKKWTEKYAMN